MSKILILLISQNGVTNAQSSLTTYTGSDFFLTIYFPYISLVFFLGLIFTTLFLLFFFKRQENLLLLLLYLELFILLLGFAFAILSVFSFSYYTGLVYGLTLLALSAAESVVGLSLLLFYFRTSKGSVKLDDLIKKD